MTRWLDLASLDNQLCLIFVFTLPNKSIAVQKPEVLLKHSQKLLKNVTLQMFDFILISKLNLFRL